MIVLPLAVEREHVGRCVTADSRLFLKLRPYNTSSIKVISLQSGQAVKSIMLSGIGNRAALLNSISQISGCYAEGPLAVEQRANGFSVAARLIPGPGGMLHSGRQVWQSFSDRPSRTALLSDWRLFERPVRQSKKEAHSILERDADDFHVHLGAAVGSVQEGWFAVASWTGPSTLEVRVLNKLGHDVDRPGLCCNLSLVYI